MSLDIAQDTPSVSEIQDPFFTVTPELQEHQGKRYMVWPPEAEAVVQAFAWLGFQTATFSDALVILYDADADKRLHRLVNLIGDIRWARIRGQVVVVESEADDIVAEVAHG